MSLRTNPDSQIDKPELEISTLYVQLTLYVRLKGDSRENCCQERGGRGSPAPSHHRDVRGVDRLHADHVIAGIDVQDLAGGAGGQIAQEIQRRAADVLDRCVA